MKIKHKDTNENIQCSKCKSDTSWIIHSLHALNYNKYFCNNCGVTHCMYTDPNKYYHTA